MKPDTDLAIKTKEIATTLHRNNRNLFKLAYIYPSNFDSEKIKFFNSSTYNPVFTYAPLKPVDLKEELKRVEGFIAELNYSALEEYLLEIVQHQTVKINLRHSIGTTGFPIYAKQFHNWSFNLIEDYSHYLASESTEQSEANLLGSNEIQRILSEALEERDLEGWKIEINTENKFTVSVDGAEKIIYVGADLKRTIENIDKLIVHEIETHVYRKENAMLQDMELIESDLIPQYELVEEGLATFNENLGNYVTDSDIKIYVGRYIACKNNGLSFREIYNLLLEKNFDKEMAYLITFRAKRGMTDTSKEGGFLKDSSYLIGFDNIKQKVKTQNDLKFFYMGKITEKEYILENLGLISLDRIKYLPETISKLT